MGGEKVVGICALLFAIVFFVLTIVVPIVLVVNPDGDPCSPARSLNNGEQMVCSPDDLYEDYVAKYGSSGRDFINVYKINNKTHNLQIESRSYVTDDYHVSLFRSYDYYAFSVPISASGELSITCSGTYCDEVKLYLLDEAKFDFATDSDGDFHESFYVPDIYGLNEGTDSYTITATGPHYFYLVASLSKSSTVSLTYHITLYYSVYDMSSFSPLHCDDQECEFDDDEMSYGDMIIMDFPHAIYAPSSVDASIRNKDINWSSVIACAFVFGVFFFICLIIALVFLMKCLKKAGKKVATATVAPVAAAPVAAAPVAAAPVAAAPVAQPYPAQPYPGQAYPAAQPYPAQPYPGQPYPGQPYPAGASM